MIVYIDGLMRRSHGCVCVFVYVHSVFANWFYEIYIVCIFCVALHLKLMGCVLHVSLHSLVITSKCDQLLIFS